MTIRVLITLGKMCLNISIGGLTPSIRARGDEVLGLDRQHVSPDHPGEPGPHGQRHRQDDDPNSRPQDDHNNQRHQDGWEAQGSIGNPHDYGIGPSSRVA